jgi:ubiquitin carboxyl-terminal hydrolase L5
MDDSNGWCTIESDPGVFTELVDKLGVHQVEFQEIFGLDEETIRGLGEVHGLIFLFKFKETTTPSNSLPGSPEGIFFAKQVINNACATQAILSVLLNLDPTHVDIGETLKEFESFTEGLDDESRGFAIGNSDQIRTAHNSFRPNVSLEISHEEQKGEAFHFVSYVWVKGVVYELDGLQSGPVYVGACPEQSNWLSIATPYIQSRIAEYRSSGDEEIRFNLMAIVKDRREELVKQINGISNLADPLAMELQARLEELESQRSMWRKENMRRRHDFMPLALSCLQSLAEKGELVALFNEARK